MDLAIIILLIMICIGLAIVWSRSIGLFFGSAAAFCRFWWLFPIILSLSPESVSVSIPSSYVQQPIQVLVDDSDSMLTNRRKRLVNDDVQQTLQKIEDECQVHGCLPKVTRLSELRQETLNGFTPLSSVLDSWLIKAGSDPWIVLTDGADWQPNQGWDDRLRGRGTGQKGRELGLVVGFGKPASPGYWIDKFKQPNFAFEGRTTEAEIEVGRADSSQPETVQVQVLVDGSLVASAEADFGMGAVVANTSVIFNAPDRGSHLVKLRVLPVRGERDLWDNDALTTVDVMPNTIGVLHLLGAPSWDGRFVRRYLKAEPKFDVISFFILRDKWDSQDVSEREMSLIAFPVERLFKEELSNFRVIVLQDFAMHQFLDAEYQENLVKFVKEGGGLLFIGGPRALSEMDMLRSPMAELLPFSVRGTSTKNLPFMAMSETDEVGTTFDPAAKFKIEFAEPDEKKRSLASLFDVWRLESSRLTTVNGMSGIHRLGQVATLTEHATPLLQARLSSGETLPLAIASYPGRGRALWILSDSFWKMAMNESPEKSRFDYQAFMDQALTWLVRNDRRPILTASHFTLDYRDVGELIRWRVRLDGPAARYVGAKGGEWTLSVCDEVIAVSKISVDQQGGNEWILSGQTSAKLRPGSICHLKIQSEHPAFGSVSATAVTMLHEILSDLEMSSSPRNLYQLASLTGAKYIGLDDDRLRQVAEWIQSWTGNSDRALPNRFKTIRDFYWVQSRPWIWMVPLFILFEVLLRRWHLLIGRKATDE
jgi:hypothetical protein